MKITLKAVKSELKEVSYYKQKKEERPDDYSFLKGIPKTGLKPGWNKHKVSIKQNMPLTPEQFEGLKELAEQGAGRFEMFKYIAGFIKKKSGKYGILPSSVGTLLADECNNDSEFAAQMFEANLISWAFWEKQGRVNLHNKDFQVGLYNKNVENRLGWSQKTEITGKDGKDLYANAKESNMTPEEAYNALKENI